MSTATITNTVRDAAGNAVAGCPVTIRLMPAGGFRTSDSAELAKTLHTTTNSSGVWSVALERNEDISPAGTYYQVLEKIPGGERKWNFIAASSGTLFDALVSTPPSIPQTQYLTQDSADARYVLSPGTFGSAVDVQPVVGGDTAGGGSEDAYARVDHRHAFAIDTDYLADDNGTLTIGPNLPLGVLAYDEADANADITSNLETTLATATVTMKPGRMYAVKGSVNFSADNTGTGVLIRLVQLGDGVRRRIFQGRLPVANETQGAETTWVVTVPTEQSRTYRVTAQNTNSVGTLTLRGGAATANSSACFIVVEDIGPVPA